MVSTFRGIVRAAAACAALFLSTSASAVYVFNTVSYPGSVMTDVRGLNGTGRIVGYASVDGVNNFSFSYAGGVFSLLPSSGVTATAHGINAAGVIVGTTFEDPSPSRGFVLSGGASGPAASHGSAAGCHLCPGLGRCGGRLPVLVSLGPQSALVYLPS